MSEIEKRDERKDAIKFVVKNAIQLGATMGTWLDTDIKFNNRACFDAMHAMLPHFVDEIVSRLKEIERAEAGYCRLCGQKEKPQ